MVGRFIMKQIRQLTLDLSIKRDIGHLCHDEQRPKVQEKPLEPTVAVPALSYTPGILFSICFHSYIYCYCFQATVYAPQPQPTSSWPMSIPPFLYQPEMFGNEFSILTYVSTVSPLLYSPLPNPTETSWKPSMMAHSSALQRQSALPLSLLLPLREV